MNEQAIIDSYNLFASRGYNGSIDNFKQLIASNPDALNDSYDIFKTQGYSDDIESYKELMGLKKKETEAPEWTLTQQTQAAQGMARRKMEQQQAAQQPAAPTPSTAPAAMESSLGASSLASPSAEERGLTLLTPEKSKQMAQEAVTGTYMGSQKAAPVMKVEALPVSAPSKSEADFSSSLEEVNKDLMDYDEDYIVPKLEYLFGKDKYGFEFSQARVGREAVEVKAPNGKTMVVPVDAWTEKGDIESAEAFKKFLNENKPKLAKLSDEYNIYQSTIKNEQDMKKATESMNAETMQLNKIQQDLVLENNNLDKELKYLQSVPQSERGSQDYINRLEQFNKQREDFSARLGNASQMEKDVTMKQNQLYTSIGRYTSMRAEQGGFFGGLYNSLLGGYSSMGAAATGIATDVIMSLPLELTSSPKDIQDTFTMVASSKGIEVPANMDYEKFKQWSQTLDEDTKSEINSQVKDYLTKRTKGEMLPSIRKGLTETIGAKGTTPEYIQDAGLIKGGIYGLAASLPAMSFAGAGPAGTMSAFFLQGYDATMKEMESEEFKDVSENEKYLVALPVGIVSAALEEFGMRNVLGKSGLVNDIVAKALSKSGAGTTATTFKQLVENEIESRVARGALVLTAAGLSEAETGATQAAVEIGIKELYNTVKGKDMFKTPETVGEFVKEVAIAGAQEAIGGVVMGSFNAVGTAYGENNFDGVTNETLDIYSKLANDDNARSAYAVDLKIKIVKGEITPEQGKKALDDLNNSISVFNSIPDGLAPAQQRQAFSLLRERKGLEAEIQGKDEAMVKKQKARIAEINSELEKVSEMKEEAAPAEAPSVAPSEAKPAEIPQEIASLADDENVVMTVKTLDEVPEEFRDRAKKVEGLEVTYRKKIFGLPIGKKTTEKIGDGFRYTLTGKEAKDYAIQKQTAGQVPVQPTARPSEEVAQGEPQAEPQVTAQAGVEEEVSRLEQAFGGEFAPVSDIEAKKADIERRRQEELNAKDPQSGKFKKNLDSNSDIIEKRRIIDEFIKNRSENLDEREWGWLESIEGWSNLEGDIQELLFEGKYDEAKAKVPQTYEERVNAKYDAELAALGAAPTSPTPSGGVSAQTQKPSGVSVSNRAQVAELETKTTDTNKKKIIKAATTAINTLKSIFPDMDIVIHESNDSYTKQVGQSTRGNFAVTRTEDGKIVGGRIDINLSRANMRTVAHEVAHAVMLKAFGDNPALFKVFRDRISNILSETRIKSLNDFASQYAENDSHEEFLVELSSALTEAQEQLKPITVNKIAQLINKVVSKITGGRLQPFGEKIQTNELIDFMNTMSSAIGRGEAIQVKGDIELNTGGEVGTFNIVSKAQIAAPKATDDSRSFIRDLVQDIDIREFNGMPFVTNMYDYTNAGVTDLGNGFNINMMGGKSYVPYIMSLQNKKIGDVSNLSAFNSKENAEAFVRNALMGKASLFAPHSGTMSESWQFQQHTFSELVNLVLDKNIMTNEQLISVFNKTIASNANNIKAFDIFNQKYKEEDISNFDSFKSNPKKIVDLLDIQNNFSPDLRKALNNAIAADKTFQKAIGIKNKEQFFERIMDPLNKGVVGGEIISVVKFDPKTLQVVKTDPKNPIDHHPSFGWAVLAKIDGIYQPSEFHKSSSVTKTYTKYNKGGKQVSRKASEPKFEEKNVASSAGAIPKVAKFSTPKKTEGGLTTVSKAQKVDKVVDFFDINGKKVKVNLDEIQVQPAEDVDLSNSDKWNTFNIKHKDTNLGSIQVKKVGDDIKIALSQIWSFEKNKAYEGPLEPLIKIITKALEKIFPKMFKGNVVIDANRGKGIGTKAYSLLAKQLKEQYGKKLISDTTRSDAAEALWRSLERKGLAKVVGDRDNAKYRWQYYYEYIVPDTATEVKEMGETFTVSKAQVDAYHGSPYDFDRFTTEKIGTGEGVQAFGWGLYFTDLKSIAETYADKLSKPNFNKFRERLIKDKLQDNVINDILDFSEYHDYDYDKVLSALIKNENTKAVDYLKDNKDLFDVSNKKVYQVSLHQGKTPDQYTWLEWDKQIGDIVFNKIKNAIQEKYGNKLEDYDGTPILKFIDQPAMRGGAIMYKALSRALKGDKAASLFLLENGIDGVKYPAESIARGVTSDTARGFNYVVFDENAVTIVSKAQKADEEVRKVVKDARAQGYSEAAIKAFLLKKGFTEQEADTLMSKPEAGKKIELGEELMEGYDKMMAEVDAIIERGLNRNAKQETILANVLKSVRESDAYKNGTDIQKEQIEREVKQAFGEKMKTAPSVGKILGTIKDVKKVTMTEMSLLKKQLTDAAKGAKDLMKVWNKANKKLTAELKDMVRSGSINTKQLVAVLRKFQNTNLLNQDSIDSFIQYMARVFADANYAERISNIRKNLRAAKRNIQTKIGVAESVQPLLQQMLSINPTLIPESVFDKYEALVAMLGQRKAVLELRDIDDVRSDVTAVMDAVTAEVSKVPDLADRFESYADKVVDEEGKVQYSETVDKMLEEDVIDASEAVLMRKYKSKIMPAAPKAKMTEAEIAQEKQDLIAAIKATKIEPSKLALRDEKESASQLSKLIDDDVLEKMDNKQLKTLLAVIGNINNGYMPHQAQIIKEVINAKKKQISRSVVNAKPLPLSRIYNKLKASISKSKNDIYQMIISNPLFNIDEVLGNFKTKDIFNALFDAVAKASATYDAAMTKIRNRLDEAHTAVSKSFGNDPAEVNRSSYRMMAYMLQLEHQTNPAGVQTKHSAMDYLEKTIAESEKGNTPYTDADIKMFREILNEMNKLKDTDGNVDLDAFYSKFNEAEKNAIKVVQEINIETRDKAMYTSSVIRGDRITPLNNYVHHSLFPDNQPDETITNISTSQNVIAGMNPSTKGKSLIARTGALSAMNFDMFAATQRGANFVMLDYYMTEPIRTAHRILNETERALEEEYGGKVPKEKRDVFNAIRQAFETAKDDYLTNKMVEDSFLAMVGQEIARQGYRAMLASVPRFASELASNMTFVMTADPLAMATGTGLTSVVMSSDAPNIMMNLMSKQTNRVFGNDTLSGRMVDRGILNETTTKGTRGTKNGVVNKIQQIHNNSTKKVKNSMELLADTLISTPDKMMIRPFWFGAFANEFEKITGTKPDFDKIAANDEAYMSENKEALDAATAVADNKSTMAGATDNAFMGILKGNVRVTDDAYVKFFKMFNGFMSRFLIFEYTTARTAVYASMGKGYLSKRQGAALLAAVTLRMTLYTLIFGILSQYMMEFFTPDDEEEDEKSLKERTSQAMAQGFNALLLGRNFGNLTKGMINYGVEWMNEKYLDFLREGEYDPYKDRLAYSFIPEEKKGQQSSIFDFVRNMLGPYTPLVKSLDFSYQRMREAQKRAAQKAEEEARPKEMFEKGKSSKELEAERIVEERKKKEMSIRIPLEVFGSLGYIPLYRDVRKIIMNKIYKDLKEAKIQAEKNKAQREADKAPFGLSISEYKRYFPKEYEARYGKGSEYYYRNEAEDAIIDAENAERRRMLDAFFNYVPKQKIKKSTVKDEDYLWGKPEKKDKKDDYLFD